MKKTIVLLALILFTFSLGGCNESDTQEVLVDFEVVGKAGTPNDLDVSVYIEKHSKVMYTRAKYGFIPLLNADGTPMIYDK